MEVTFQLTGDTDMAAIFARAIEAGMPTFLPPLVQEAEEVRATSMEIVPKDQGVLQASALAVGTGTSVTPGRVEVTIGYGGAAASYALVQHENPDFKHTPGRTYKYLENPMYAAVIGYEERLARRLGRAFEAAAARGGGGTGSGATFGGE